MSSRPSRWRFASEAARAELGETPELLLENGEEVKANPVRRVIQSGDYFLKCDLRGAARLRGEWKSAQRLALLGIPTVEHLALGEVGGGGCLITRALPDSEAVADYYWKTFVRDEENPESFLENFAHFLCTIFSSKVFHPDFHIGNILYDKTNQSFTLVDVRGVRKRRFLDNFRTYRMHRIVMELREPLSREQMIRFITDSEIPNPAAFYLQALDREAERLWEEWPKRRRQILAGYPKFTRCIDGVLYAVTPARELTETVNSEVIKGDPEELKNIFLAHFFLQMALIPHRNALGIDLRNGVLYQEPTPPGAIPVQAPEQRKRLQTLDLPSELTDWITPGRGGAIRFFNLRRLARYM